MMIMIMKKKKINIMKKKKIIKMKKKMMMIVLSYRYHFHHPFLSVFLFSVSPSSHSCVSFCPRSRKVSPETGLFRIPFYFASDFILNETFQKPNARSKLEGTRRRERKEWKEEVERDLQVLGVRRWRELVADRKKWKDIVRQAKAHSGL